jgi:hypothetical protein
LVRRNTIDDIVEAFCFFIPKCSIECPTGNLRHSAIAIPSGFIADLLGEVLGDAQRVVLEGLNFYRLRSPRSHHPIANVGIHPISYCAPRIVV